MSVYSVAPGIWIAACTLADLDVPMREACSARAAQSLGARHLLRGLLARVLPDVSTAPLARTGSGTPVLAGHPEVRVSLSHDGEWIAAAVGCGRAVGIDVQLPVTGSGRRLVRRCAARYATDLQALPDDRLDREVAWIWSVQEACVKARGTGLSGLPWTLDVPPFRTGGRLGGLHWASFRDRFAVPVSCAYEAASRATCDTACEAAREAGEAERARTPDCGRGPGRTPAPAARS